VPVVAWQDARAGLGPALDQALGAEDADRLAIGGARDAERGARLDLAAEHFAGPALAADDLGPEVAGDRPVDAARGIRPVGHAGEASRLPSIRRAMPHGLPSATASGSSPAGMLWKHTGRRKRMIASVPTEVVRLSLVAGNGPPWTIAGLTSTPVGQPLASTRPARPAITGTSFAASASSAGSRWSVAVSCPSSEARTRTISSRSRQRITSEDEPNTSWPSARSARKLAASVSNSAPVPWLSPSPTQPRATVRTASWPSSGLTPRS